MIVGEGKTAYRVVGRGSSGILRWPGDLGGRRRGAGGRRFGSSGRSLLLLLRLLARCRGRLFDRNRRGGRWHRRGGDGGSRSNRFRGCRRQCRRRSNRCTHWDSGGRSRDWRRQRGGLSRRRHGGGHRRWCRWRRLRGNKGWRGLRGHRRRGGHWSRSRGRSVLRRRSGRGRGDRFRGGCRGDRRRGDRRSSRRLPADARHGHQGQQYSGQSPALHRPLAKAAGEESVDNPESKRAVF